MCIQWFAQPYLGDLEGSSSPQNSSIIHQAMCWTEIFLLLLQKVDHLARTEFKSHWSSRKRKTWDIFSWIHSLPIIIANYGFIELFSNLIHVFLLVLNLVKIIANPRKGRNRPLRMMYGFSGSILYYVVITALMPLNQEWDGIVWIHNEIPLLPQGATSSQAAQSLHRAGGVEGSTEWGSYCPQGMYTLEQIELEPRFLRHCGFPICLEPR